MQLAAQSQPDLAIVDLSLPDTSGWDLARELRAAPGLERTKILIASANAHEYSPVPGSLHDAFLTKPIDLIALVDKVGELLNVDWIYETEPAPAVRLFAPSHAPSARSRHHLDDLYRLGRIGHVRGIEAKLRELELEDPVNEAFAAQLRSLVGNFDLKRYMNLLETLRASN